MAHSRFVLVLFILFVFADKCLADGFEILSEIHTISGMIGTEIAYNQTDSQPLSDSFTNSNGSFVSSSTEIGSMGSFAEFTCAATAFVEWPDQERDIEADARASYTLVFQPKGDLIEIHHVLGSCEGLGGLGLLRLTDLTTGTVIYIADNYGGNPEGVYSLNPEHIYELYVYAGTTTDFYNCAGATAYFSVFWDAIYVDDDNTTGPWDGSYANPFQHIQDGINAATDGIKIIVTPGTYMENISINNKCIELTSADPNDPNVVAATIIDGQQLGSVMTIKDSNSIIAGFTITNGFAEQGGGLQSIDSLTSIINCTFENNTAEDGGGGIYNYADELFADFLTLKLKNCVFRENSSPGEGGGIATIGANSELISCTFVDNSADWGTAIALDHAAIELTRCSFIDNFSQIARGVIEGNSVCILKNCMITGNSGGVQLSPGRLTITNCILWGNSDYQIYMDNEFPPEITVAYSDIQGGWPGEGNIDTNPLFADPNNGGFHLKSEYGRWNPNSQSWIYDTVTSPCIDAGDPADPNWVNELWPHGKRINMGAYGGTPQASKSPSDAGNIADFTFDNCVGIEDLAKFLEHWLTCQYLIPEDMDLDGCVNLADFSIFAQNWFYCPTSDLVGFWEFNETGGIQAGDSSVYGNHGTLVNGPVWTGTGEIIFNGIDDYVQVPDSASLEFTSQITISAWIKLTDDNTRFMKIVIQPANPTSADPWENYCIDLRRKNPRFILSSGVSGSWIGAYDTTFSSPLTVGAWYHLAGTYDGSTMILYVNGESTQSKAVSLTIGNNELPLYIGSAFGTNGFGGQIDEVRIYNRALSETEIQNLYQNH